MSASSTPTLSPREAIAAARLTVTLDLPTPPLPDATAYTRVSDPGWANGMTGSRASPRSILRSSVRCSSFITSRLTLTAPVPGTSATALVTRSEISVFFGHAEVVRYTSTWTPALSSQVTLLTMPSSVIGLRSSGSITLVSAARTADSSSGRGGGRGPVGVWDITAESRPTRRGFFPGRQAAGPGAGPGAGAGGSGAGPAGEPCGVSICTSPGAAGSALGAGAAGGTGRQHTAHSGCCCWGCCSHGGNHGSGSGCAGGGVSGAAGMGPGSGPSV